MNLRLVAAFLAAFPGLAVPLVAAAAPGEFDRGFADNGVFRSSDPAVGGPGSRASHVVTDRFGNVFASGSANGGEVVVRLFANGAPDESLGPSGALVAMPPLLFSYAGLGAFPVGDGKVILVRAEKFACFGPGASFCANAPADVRVRRIDQNGPVDPTYAAPERLAAGAMGDAFQVVEEPDGGLLFAGWQGILIGGNRIGRLDRNGVPDAAFEANAMAALACRDLPPTSANGIRVLRQGDGRILVARSFRPPAATLPDPGNRICVTRLAPNGERESGYGAAGELVLDQLLFASASNRLVAVLPLANGGAALVVEQYTQATSYRYHYVVAWLTAGGSLDATRSGGGISGPTDLHVAKVAAAAMQPDGKILLAGYPGLPAGQSTPDYDLSQPRVGRLTPQGGADLAFGPDSSGYTPLLSFGSRVLPSHLHIAPGGEIFVAGASGEAGPVNPGESTRFAIAKLRGDAEPAPSGSGGGGCGIVTGAPPDPTLPGLALLALGALFLRRRGGGAGSPPRMT